MRRPPTGGHYIKGADAMFSISVCMIVKNEEKVIGRCLSCVRSFADEIIVVDMSRNGQMTLLPPATILFQKQTVIIRCGWMQTM